MKTINKEEYSLLEKVLGSSSIHQAAIIRLYFSSNNQWQQQIVGAATIVTDHPSNSNFLKVIDLKNRRIFLTQPIIRNMEYSSPKLFFHTFQSERNVVGFSFADETEAQEFFSEVNRLLEPPQRKLSNAEGLGSSARVPLPIRLSMQGAPSPSQAPTVAVTTTTSSSASPAITPSSSGSSNSSNGGTERNKKKKRGILSSLFGKKELVISEPTEFRHVSSIGWNPATRTFDIKNIPPEWRKVFQEAKVSKRDLLNADTAEFVMKFIEQHGGVVSRPPPPPPPVSTERALPPKTTPPPPTPPRNSQVSTVPPPLPPRDEPNPPMTRPRGGSRPLPVPPTKGSAPIPPAIPIPAAPTSRRASSPPDSQRVSIAASTSSDTRGGLMEQIRGGATLRKVQEVHEVKVSSEPPSGIAETLARAMAERRFQLKEDIIEDDDWSEDWSV